MYRQNENLMYNIFNMIYEILYKKIVVFQNTKKVGS